MYAGAQRVRSRERTGINVFRYSHGSSPIPRTATGHPDLNQVANHHPGQLISALQDVPPGFNDVLSFLDVAAPDEIALSEVTLLLELVELEISKAHLPKTWYAQAAEVTVTFSARNLSGEPARQEYDALKRRLLRLLAEDHAVAADAPLDAQLIKGSDGYELIWTPPAKARLVAAGFHPAARLRVAYDVVDQWDVSGLPGPLIAHSLAAMAGADLHELVRRGGVRVLSDTRAIVWQRLPP
jgi:hypothetical protein